MIHRIDICRIVDIDDQLVNDFCSGKYATYKSLNNEKGAISRFDRTSVQGHTVYCDYASKKTRVLTLAVYRPCNKRDKNKRLDRNAVKFEFRLKYESIKTRYAFGKKVTPLSLIASIEQDSAFIQKTFDRILASRKIKP